MFEVADNMLVVKGNALGVIKVRAYQSKWYGLDWVFAAKHIWYELITTSSNFLENLFRLYICANIFVDQVACFSNHQQGPYI